MNRDAVEVEHGLFLVIWAAVCGLAIALTPGGLDFEEGFTVSIVIRVIWEFGTQKYRQSKEGRK
jgi:hypothetical protein